MRKTKQDAELTRREILDAAARIFSEKGFNHSSLEEIAKAAKVTRGAIYWHFKNKAEIFDALHQQLYQRLEDMILEDLEVDDSDPLGQLKDFSCQLLLGIDNHDETTKHVLLLFLNKNNYSGELAQYRDKHYQTKVRCMALFKQYFQNAVDCGQLPANTDIDNMTCALHCYTRGIISQHFECPEDFPLAAYVPNLMALFFRNITATTS